MEDFNVLLSSYLPFLLSIHSVDLVHLGHTFLAKLRMVIQFSKENNALNFQ